MVWKALEGSAGTGECEGGGGGGGGQTEWVSKLSMQTISQERERLSKDRYCSFLI